jgi:glycine C-acetyltransferase
MNNMREPIKYLREEFERLVKEKLVWEIKELQSASEPICLVNKKVVIMMCANNYLNLATDPRVVSAMIKVTKEYGAGAGSDRSIAGNMTIHEKLDSRLAEFKRAPASLSFQTGFMTNQGLIPQLCSRGDLFVSDELNHGSIIDGIRLSRADRAIYKHKDVEDLSRILEDAENHKPPYKNIWIITDGVFSMDGDLAPLPEIAKIASDHGAGLYVDDAHGEGILGEGGRGIVSHFGLPRTKIHIEMGTFSKAFGVMGGHITGSKDIRNFAINKARTWLLSGAVPPGIAAACIASINILEEEPEIVEKVWENRRYFIEEMQDLGFDTGNSETPIVPIICGRSKKAKALADYVWRKGIFALPIVYPMVPIESARIRIQLCAKHTKQHLDKAIQAFKHGGKSLKII